MKIRVPGIKKIKKLFLLIITILIIVSGCFFGTTVENTVTPTIRTIGLPDASAVGSVTLKVTGPDMDPIEVNYSTLPSVINIAIPEGNDRTFELSVGLTPAFIAASPGIATSYKGTGTADINTDSAVVTLNMGVASTKLVIPDAYNNRIVQIDDMSGAGWSIAKWSDLGFSNNYDFIPYDVDMDQYGNIYIANNVWGTGGIYKINSIAFNTILPLEPSYYYDSDGYADVTAVSIDQRNNRVYGITPAGSEVRYWSYDGLPIDGEPFVSPSETITGLAIDNDGNVYISGYFYAGDDYLWLGKYSSSGGSALATYSGTLGGETARDLTISNGELFVTKSGGGTKIDKFDLELNFLDSYGTSGSVGTEGQFVGPYNFVAVMNKKLTIVDSAMTSAQLVSFDDISGTNWATFGSFDNSGGGTNVFKFFSSC